MASTANILVTLYGPAALTILVLFTLTRVKKRKSTVVTFQPFGVLGVSVPISSYVLARILLVGSASGFLILYAFLDFSVLFPKHLQMEVFFDAAGVSRTLTEYFHPADLERLGIAKSYNQERQAYFDILDREVRSVLGNSRFFSLANGAVHSSGDTSFVVAKIDGVQRYYLEESKGELLHTLDAPHQPEQQFYTFFERLNTADDYISPSFSDLIIKRRVILRPRFKQLLAENRTSKTVTFSVSVIGITSVTLFPWPSFSPTVYCADFQSAGLIPIAYAIYK